MELAEQYVRQAGQVFRTGMEPRLGKGVLVILLTLSCLKKQSIFSSRKTLLQETRFWKTLGIFLRATRLPSLGSVTDLEAEESSREEKA